MAARASDRVATTDECVADAYAVCGAPVDPWVLYY